MVTHFGKSRREDVIEYLEVVPWCAIVSHLGRGRAARRIRSAPKSGSLSPILVPWSRVMAPETWNRGIWGSPHL